MTGADGELRVSRRAVQEAVTSERSWEAAAQTLGVRPGFAFMVATGVPADGSGVPDLAGRTAGGPTPTSPQRLVNARAHNPQSNERVQAWVRERAGRELSAGQRSQ